MLLLVVALDVKKTTTSLLLGNYFEKSSSYNSIAHTLGQRGGSLILITSNFPIIFYLLSEGRHVLLIQRELTGEQKY